MELRQLSQRSDYTTGQMIQGSPVSYSLVTRVLFWG